MLTKRIIPCLDIAAGRTVKGVRFEHLADAGDPVELAIRYCDEGADELVFLDISATNERRGTLVELVRRIASNINIPFTVGGGIRSVEDVSVLLSAGADKISINSAAVTSPTLIEDVARRFGNQCVVVAFDTRVVDGEWMVYLNGGRLASGISARAWAQEATNRGAGELLVTSMDHDGTKKGFAVELIRTISQSVGIPVIASGGAGAEQDFLEVFREGAADAALAASLFHYRELTIGGLKSYLAQRGIPIRK
ncbi:MAG: imidazole glycerol phosphate synthase subunit HisF [Bacteroidetes bacterium]|nr:imidazole glycerol phosphate synthase subunit HisF [Bacteroidota bacterium]